jgi:hypothetical protein
MLARAADGHHAGRREGRAVLKLAVTGFGVQLPG